MDIRSSAWHDQGSFCIGAVGQASLTDEPIPGFQNADIRREMHDISHQQIVYVELRLDKLNVHLSDQSESSVKSKSGMLSDINPI